MTGFKLRLTAGPVGVMASTGVLMRAMREDWPVHIVDDAGKFSAEGLISELTIQAPYWSVVRTWRFTVRCGGFRLTFIQTGDIIDATVPVVWEYL